MARGKKVTAEDLALRIAKAKAKAAAEQKQIEQLERKHARLEEETRAAGPALRLVPKAKRKLPKAEVDILIEMARKSLEEYGTVLPPKEVQYMSMDATCPHCDPKGENPRKLATDFGFKKVRNAAGEEIIKPQSWCRDCRNGKASHPGRFGRN